MNLKNRTKNIKAEIVAHSKSPPILEKEDFIFEISTEDLFKIRNRGKKNIITNNFYGKNVIYCWLLNNKLYIGQTTNLNVRLKNYLSGIYTETHYFARALNKYLRKKGSYFYIMCICDTKEELNEKEKFYISKYDTTNRDKGYNLTEGGENPTVSEDTLRKMINSAQNKKKVYCKVIEEDRIIEFESRRDCGRKLNIDIGTIYGGIKRKSIVSKKYYFSYDGDFTNHSDKTINKSNLISTKLKNNRNGTKYIWKLYKNDILLLERDSLLRLRRDSNLNIKESTFRRISEGKCSKEEFKEYKITKHLKNGKSN
jgi:intron-associated endonuclease 1|nr:MAG TPA: intron associated endonuclease [Caudoviricetes sp.]